MSQTFGSDAQQKEEHLLAMKSTFQACEPKNLLIPGIFKTCFWLVLWNHGIL